MQPYFTLLPKLLPKGPDCTGDHSSCIPWSLSFGCSHSRVNAKAWDDLVRACENNNSSGGRLETRCEEPHVQHHTCVGFEKQMHHHACTLAYPLTHTNTNTLHTHSRTQMHACGCARARARARACRCARALARLRNKMACETHSRTARTNSAPANWASRSTLAQSTLVATPIAAMQGTCSPTVCCRWSTSS